MRTNRLTIIYIFFIFLSFVVGFIFNEDSLGGAKNDYFYHLDYFYKFNNNFYDTFNNYGLDQTNNSVRNSPIFYILGSLVLKGGLPISLIKFLSIIITLLICITFYQCLIQKYGRENRDAFLLISSILLLSPTIRSLTFWPYPFLIATFLFLISIFFYLKFRQENNSSKKLKYALLNTLFLACSAYFTPNFGIFVIFYLINFFNYFKNNYKFFLILLINFIISLPALIFITLHEFYLFKSEVFYITNSEKYNLSNKIIIITSFLFLFFIPFIELKNFKNKFSLKFNKKFYLLIFFTLTNIYFFSFLAGAGGGIFYHLSNILNTNLVIYLIFILALYIFNVNNFYNSNNILIFTLLIIYNLQYTIYYKYFDPLLLFIFLFLIINIKFDFSRFKIKLLVFYSIFLLLNIGKKFIY
ncbi:hypothetical protein OAN07_02020 [Candidatus Pelagibacter sp.]|nr:hypothetical protein [Candidatus Pelagibacter sp.]